MFLRQPLDGVVGVVRDLHSKKKKKRSLDGRRWVVEGRDGCGGNGS